MEFGGYDNYVDHGDFSSDDELETVPSKNKKELTFEDDEDESSDDDFEKEMKCELANAMSNYKSTYGYFSNPTEPDTDIVPRSSYDKEYFDSDEEEDVGSKSRDILSNDELLYDPLSDDLDKQWVEQERFKYQPKGSRKNKSSKPTNSDAILNCPCCMTLLCLDCQQHAVYEFQFRAMFVKNCKILFDEVKKCPKKDVQKKKKNEQELMEVDSNDDDFHPVKCSICDTEVAAYDKEEIYHFYNVLASH